MNSLESTPLNSQSVTMRLTYPNQNGMFARIAETIGKHGGDLGQVDLLGSAAKLLTRGVNVRAGLPQQFGVAPAHAALVCVVPQPEEFPGRRVAGS